MGVGGSGEICRYFLKALMNLMVVLMALVNLVMNLIME